MTPGEAGDSRWPLLRWLISSATLNVPQAAGPIAFSLLALSLTGEARQGAAMILAMTIAQVLGVVPVTRLGASFPAVTFLRALVAARCLALAAIALGAWCELSFAWLVVLAALAGLMHAAAHGYLRVVLNFLVPAARLPRALGIAATLNELTFVLAPVAASGLGVVSPAFAVLVVAILSAFPALLIPAVGGSRSPAVAQAGGRTLSLPIVSWLMCATAGGAAVAVIEIGAVALALKFNYQPAWAIFFTVPLCLASVAGGLWVSIRNRMSSRRTVLAQLSAMTLGSVLAAADISLPMTVVGVVLVGAVLAPLGTHYSLALDGLAPAEKRAEVFAFLRTANAVGIIFASSLLTFASLSVSLIVVAGLMMIVTVGIGIASFTRRFDRA